MAYIMAIEPEKIEPPKIWTKWEWRGCVRPVFDIAGGETWAVRYRCPRCGALMGRPCDKCQEWDCYGCDYKQTERSK